MSRNLGTSIGKLIERRRAAKQGAYWTSRSGIVDSPYENQEVEEWNEFESLQYDKDTEHLSFVLRHYTKNQK